MAHDIGVNIIRVVLGTTILALALLAGCRTSSSKYKYLQQGQIHIRIDETSGRTDRLTDNGWVPISFESPSTEVPKEQLKRASATIVPGDIFDRIAGPICYIVDNDSDYVLKEIWVSLPVRESKDSAAESKESKKKDEAPLLLPLSSQTGGFAPVGNKFIMCYDRKFDLSAWVPERAEIISAHGWKQQ